MSSALAGEGAVPFVALYCAHQVGVFTRNGPVNVDVEMLFQTCEQAQCLQTVDAELLEKVVVGREALARDLELRRGKVEDFINRLLLGSHDLYYGKYGCASVLSTNFFSAAWTVGRA